MRPVNCSEGDQQPVAYTPVPQPDTNPSGGSDGGTVGGVSTHRIVSPPTKFLPYGHFMEVHYPTAKKYEKSITSIRVLQSEFQHDRVVIDIAQPTHNHAYHRSGTPVIVRWGYSASNSQTFYGYVHHVKPVYAPRNPTLRIVCLGASWKMKEPLQKIYKKMTDADIARHVIHKFDLQADVQKTQRVHKQYPIHGKTGWEVLKKLAHESGYTLYCHGHKVHFHSRKRDIKRLADHAPVFTVRNVLSQHNQREINVFKFEPEIDESGELGGLGKRHLYTIDDQTGAFVEAHDYLTSDLRERAAPNSVQNPIGLELGFDLDTSQLFDIYETGTSARNRHDAQWALQYQQDGHAFHLRAHLHGHGNRHVHQGIPVYVNVKSDKYRGLWYVSEAQHIVTGTNGYQLEMTLLRDSLGSSHDQPTTKRERINPSIPDGTCTPEETLAQDMTNPTLRADGVWVAPYITTRCYTVPSQQLPTFVGKRLQRFTL